jgi:hypothetical protein
MRKRQLNSISSNETMGHYRPIFFALPEFKVKSVDFESHFFEEEDLSLEILSEGYSFAYLREGKLRTVKADTEEGAVSFEDFLSRFNLEIDAGNIFKAGKYLSRVFRPAKYGGWYEELSLHVNAREGKDVDGISLVSTKLARDLGWLAKPGMSGQFTLLFNGGLVKGHCLITDKIEGDIVVYSENVKEDVKLTKDGLYYVAIEPVKLGKSLRLDIQTMLNVWEMFGEEQFFRWTLDGIEAYVDDLLHGNLAEYLDDIESKTLEEIDQEEWKLKKAIYHGIDYRQYPGLFRSAWTMYRNAILRIPEDKSGMPVFHIPVLGGFRAYIRPDLRDHDGYGNFEIPPEEKITLDKYGNLWISGKDRIEDLLQILGGGDWDDGVGIIPLVGGKALVYRNPNQKGEFTIEELESEVTPKKLYTLKCEIKQKKLLREEAKKDEVKNSLIALYKEIMPTYAEERYDRYNIMRTYSRIKHNGNSIGLVANAEMIRSSLKISDGRFGKVMKNFDWNLERVIDSTVKEGVSASDDLNQVERFYKFIAENKIKVSEALRPRIPEKYRMKTVFVKSKLDELLEAIKYVVADMEIKMIGDGVVGKDRIPGYIDKIVVPIKEIMLNNLDNPMISLAVEMLKDYNSEIAMILSNRKNQLEDIGDKIKAVQQKLAEEFTQYTREEQIAIVLAWAEEIYKSTKFVHDSILWINGTTADVMIDMLANIGVGLQIKKNGAVKRYREVRKAELGLKAIRLWDRRELKSEDFHNATEIFVDGSQALLGDRTLNLGDEITIPDGIYKVKSVNRAFSKKTGRTLRNSIEVLVEINV